MMSPISIIAAGVGALALFAGGVKLGHEWGSTTTEALWQEKVIAEGKTQTALLRTKQNDLDQCRAQVEEINRVTAENEQRIAALILDDQETRRQAQAEARRRAAENAERGARLTELLDQLREDINASDFNPCMGEPVDPGYIELLNELVETATD